MKTTEGNPRQTTNDKIRSWRNPKERTEIRTNRKIWNQSENLELGKTAVDRYPKSAISEDICGFKLRGGLKRGWAEK
jgi:hypothetical protein